MPSDSRCSARRRAVKAASSSSARSCSSRSVFFQAKDGIRDIDVTGVQTCALPILAMLNSGRFGFPRPGILPRPGVEDALRGAGKEPARSFQDLLAKPHVYGDYNPKAGDVGTEVIEAYYRRISGSNTDTGRLKYDRATLKLFDAAIENGLTDEQLFKVVDALKLKPVPLR